MIVPSPSPMRYLGYADPIHYKLPFNMDFGFGFMSELPPSTVVKPFRYDVILVLGPDMGRDQD